MELNKGVKNVHNKVPDEKSLKFRQNFERKATTAVKAIRNIGKLTDKRRYAYTPESVAKAFKAMHRELEEAEKKLMEPINDKDEPFHFRLED